MASVSIESAIVFIASIVVAAGVAGVLTNQVGQLSQAIDDQGLEVSQQVRTDLEIISDPGSSNCCYNATTNNVTVLIKNVGSRELPKEPGQIDVLVDGEYVDNVSVSVVDGSTWERGNVARIEATKELSEGDHRVKVIIAGDEELLEFRGGETL